MSGNERGSGYKEILVNDFTEVSARKFREDFLYEAAQDLKRPIIVWIDSNGGDVDALATMVETIKSVPNKIVTACIGKAQSCGAILLSFGDERYCGEYSRIMVHGFSALHSRTPTPEHLIDATESLRLESFWLGQFAKNCKIEGGLAILRQKIKDGDGKIWLDAEGAKAFGLVDCVGIPKVKSEISFSM